MNNDMRARLDMLLTLDNLVSKGISLFISGQKATPEEVVSSVMLNEESDYMADFVQDENGRLQQICYDRIDNY